MSRKNYYIICIQNTFLCKIKIIVFILCLLSENNNLLSRNKLKIMQNTLYSGVQAQNKSNSLECD